MPKKTFTQSCTSRTSTPPSRLISAREGVLVAVGGGGVYVAVLVGVLEGGGGVLVGVLVGGTGVLVGVLVGGKGVLVAVLVGVLVGGTGVLVGVLVGGIGVLVAVLVGVLVGGTGVLVAVAVGVLVAVSVGVGVGVAVPIGGTAVLVGVSVEAATVIVGVGVGLGRAATAKLTWIRGIPVTLPPPRESSMDAPVLESAVRIASTEAPESFDFNTAQAPVTCGAAIDVPLLEEYASPGTDEFIEDPGARSEMKEAMLEKEETESDEVVDPTLIAVEIHAGAPIAVLYPLFPDEITVAIPTDRS